MPSPTATASARATKRSRNGSKICSWTKKRVGEVQTWPALRYLRAAELTAAALTSVSSQTMTGAWPPSSMSTGVMCSEASEVRRRPTAVEPVKATSLVTGLGIRWPEMSAGTPNTRFNTPGGRPASSNARAMCSVPAGVSSAAFKMMEHPEASAPATLRAGWLIGKFHGENAATGPMG